MEIAEETLVALTNDVRRIVAERAVRDQDMMISVLMRLQDLDNALHVKWFVTRNMSDPKWHLSVTEYHRVPGGFRHKCTVVTRTEDTFRTLLTRMIYPIADADVFSDIMTIIYSQGMKEPPISSTVSDIYSCVHSPHFGRMSLRYTPDEIEQIKAAHDFVRGNYHVNISRTDDDDDDKDYRARVLNEMFDLVRDLVANA